MLIFLNNAARFQRLFSPNFRFDAHHIKFESIKIRHFHYNNMNPFDYGRYQDDNNIFKLHYRAQLELQELLAFPALKWT